MYQSYSYNLEIIGLFDRKVDVNSTLLKPLTIATINESYPEPEWLGVYTDDSRTGMCGHAGARVYCQELAHYTSIPIGAEGTVFEGEVKAIKVALLIAFRKFCNSNL